MPRDMRGSISSARPGIEMRGICVASRAGGAVCATIGDAVLRVCYT